jgi:Lrp/AsnC family transcriptional regulator for asnA, asnC and gidA
LPSVRREDHDGRVTAEIRHRPLPHDAALDDAARRIIAQLQTDGRRSYAAIAKSVGLSEAAVRQRIQRLVETGVIRIVAVTDPRALGLHRQAMVGVRADGDLRTVADELVRVEEVDDVVITAGGFDLLVAVSATDDDHLLRVLDDGIRRVQGVRETETFVYLRQTKHTYPWG